MKNDFLNSVQIALFLVVLTCLVSIMALFMGGGQSSADLYSLLVAQTVAIPIALVILILVVSSTKARTLWNALPQWLVFIALLLNALALCGEAALIIATRMTDRVSPWHEHVPLVCVMACTVAFLALYARPHPPSDGERAMSGRW